MISTDAARSAASADRGRGHHRVHRLPGRHSRSANQVACLLPYRFADRLHGHTG